ncbi:conserved Plasmodium protein, unknown function [Plasmodium vivax]|uniref:Uncharacterized protein n=1 Tax=Plasmodium vivax TaxID=5855 RepID=A0A1G4GSV5_PLAVI|nr:conserved Plasmodium protein, unknown function [Plasmodium vivax]
MLLTRDPRRIKRYRLAVQAFFHSLQNGGPKRGNPETWVEGSRMGLCARNPLHRHSHRNELPNLMQIRGAAKQARTAMSSNTEVGASTGVSRGAIYFPSRGESQTVEPDPKAANNLCKKIFFLSKNGVKNESVWRHHLFEAEREKKNFHLVSTKNLFLLLLGLCKSQHIVGAVLRGGSLRGEAKETHKADVVDALIEILSKRIDRLTNGQRSLLLHIIRKLHRMERYNHVVNEINCRILEGTPLKKLSARAFSSVLHVYARSGASNTSREGEGPTCRRLPLEETISNAFSEPNGQQNKLVKILLKGKVRLEDVLRLLGAMHKLRITNKQILQCVVQILNEKVKEESYFLIPSLLLYLANLNVYSEELWGKLKVVVLQNYRFYNSVHLTNVFYGFSKFRPDGVEDLFNILASHLMERSRRGEKRLTQGRSNSVDSNPFDEPKWEGPPKGDTPDTFNLFQATNIIRSCLLCSYLNYSFFHFLLNGINRLEEPQSLENQIDSLKVVSSILKTFNRCVYKSVICFNYTEKGEDPSQQEGQPTYVHVLNSEDIHKEMLTYRCRYDPCDSHLPMVEYLSMGSTPTEEQRQFESLWDDVSNRVRKKIEQNLGTPHLKLLLHKLILSLSSSPVRSANLYALCLTLVEESKRDISVNNLFLYAQIFHRIKMYDYELFIWLVEHMKQNAHLLDVKKKAKIILLSFNIFKRINEQEVQELCRVLTSHDDSSFLEEETLFSDASPMWEIPAAINMRRSIVELDHLSRGTTPNAVYDETGSSPIDGDDSVGRSPPVGEKPPPRKTPPMGETEEDPNSALPSKVNLFHKIEKTDTLPCHLEFTDYVNFLLILIHNWRGDASERVNLRSLISKGANDLVKIGRMDATLDGYTRRLEENLRRERGTIVKLFEKLDRFSHRGPHAEEAAKLGSVNNLRSDFSVQVDYLLRFVEAISEEVHGDIVRAMGDQQRDPLRDQLGNLFAPLKRPFELKEEDLQFLNRSRGGKGSPSATPPTVHNNKTINRYLYGSVLEAINLLRRSFQLHKCSNAAGVSPKSSGNYLNGMESFYKINGFLIADVAFIFEKGGEKSFHFLLFYPHELKKTVVRKCGNRIFLKRECDESLLISTEVIFFYNFLRRHFRHEFLFSLVDTTPFVKLCQYTSGDALVGGLPDGDRGICEATRLLEAISKA